MPRLGKVTRDDSPLIAALAELERQKKHIDEQIRGVRALLGKTTNGRGRPGAVASKGGPGRLSPAARKRIAAAQKRRWAEYRKSAGKSE